LKENGRSSILKEVREFKIANYSPLIRTLRNNFERIRSRKLKFKAEFIPMEISLVEALLSKALNNLSTITGSKNKIAINI
jgi:hypothetical protein